jgi:predicted signal transduction protein with EAL and GGDEF domain
MGVAPRPAEGETAATWLAEADIALYEAKQFGRNRVVVGRARRPVAASSVVAGADPHALH